MKIKATLENRVKIQDALDSVNGRATQHVLRFASDVFAALDQAEARLAALSKAERSGAEMSYSPAGPWSKSYKYAAKGTRFCAFRGVKHWYLSCLETTDLYPCQKEILAVTITAAQAQRVSELTLSSFVVKADGGRVKVPFYARSPLKKECRSSGPYWFEFSGDLVASFETLAAAQTVSDDQEKWWLLQSKAARLEALGWKDVSDKALSNACCTHHITLEKFNA